MSEIVNCPYCGKPIESDVFQCKHCEARFQEPDLKDIQFKEFRTFLALEILTFGFFTTIWFFINGSAINRLALSAKDTLKLAWLFFLLITNLCFYFFYLEHNTLILTITTIIQYVLYIALTYRVLRIIQKHTEKVYNVVLETNPYYIVFFNILYMIHFIDTYTDRVQQTHEHFNFKSPQIILLIVILLILQFIHCMNPDVHKFYHFLFNLY